MLLLDTQLKATTVRHHGTQLLLSVDVCAVHSLMLALLTLLFELDLFLFALLSDHSMLLFERKNLGLLIELVFAREKSCSQQICWIKLVFGQTIGQHQMSWTPSHFQSGTLMTLLQYGQIYCNPFVVTCGNGRHGVQVIV